MHELKNKKGEVFTYTGGKPSGFLVEVSKFVNDDRKETISNPQGLRLGKDKWEYAAEPDGMFRNVGAVEAVCNYLNNNPALSMWLIKGIMDDMEALQGKIP